MILPPMGFLSFPANIAAAASGEDMTWFVTTTAIPYCKRQEVGVCVPLRGGPTYLVSESQQGSQEFAEMALPSR